MLQDSFHQKRTSDGLENYTPEFHPNTWKNSFSFLPTLIYGFKWLLPQVVWLDLGGGDTMLFCMKDNACSQLLLRSCVSVLEQDTEALGLGETKIFSQKANSHTFDSALVRLSSGWF